MFKIKICTRCLKLKYIRACLKSEYIHAFLQNTLIGTRISAQWLLDLFFLFLFSNFTGNFQVQPTKKTMHMPR